MRSLYCDYKSLSANGKNSIEAFANIMKGAAEHFYSNITICGFAVSDVAHPPNEVIIDEVVLNTVSDLDRVMSYHVVENPTRYKYAAYLGFWWQRSKPLSSKISIYKQAADDKWRDPRFVCICTSLNELFLTDFMLWFIHNKPPAKDLCTNHHKTFTKLDLWDSLHYFLKYRHYTAQELELFLKGLATCPLTFYPPRPRRLLESVAFRAQGES